MICTYEKCKKNTTIFKEIFPCPFCSSIFFCSWECLINGWKENHRYSCPTKLLIDTIPNSIEYNICKNYYEGEMLTNEKLLEYSKYIVFNPSGKIKFDSLNECIGIGGSGIVYKKFDKASSKIFAHKIIFKNRLLSNKAKDSSLENVKKEINIHLKLKHPNIINMYAFAEANDTFSLLLEYAEGGNLYDLIQKEGRLSIERSIFFFIQICSAINFLHSINIIHRDLKPENILISKNIVKVCDFGLSTVLNSEKRKTFCGTFLFMAPEILKNEEYDEKVDIWSLGILFYEMIHGEPPFETKDNEDILFQISKKNIRKIPSVPDNVYDLISVLLEIKPNLRPSIFQVLEHPVIIDFLNRFNILSIIPMKRTSDIKVPLDKQDSSCMNIGLEEVEGAEKRIAKLQKYNQSSQNIHMPPFFRKSKYHFNKKFGRDSIEVQSMMNPGVHFLYTNINNSKSSNNLL